MTGKKNKKRHDAYAAFLHLLFMAITAARTGFTGLALAVRPALAVGAVAIGIAAASIFHHHVSPPSPKTVYAS